MIYFKLQQGDNILGTNIEKCPFDIFEVPQKIGISKKWEHNGIEYIVYADKNEDMHSVIVVEGDKDLSRSQKLRKSLLPTVTNIFLHTAKANVERVHDYVHSVNTLHGKMKQEIENYTDPDEFYGETYADVRERIKSKVSSNLESTSDLI